MSVLDVGTGGGQGGCSIDLDCTGREGYILFAPGVGCDSSTMTSSSTLGGRLSRNGLSGTMLSSIFVGFGSMGRVSMGD